MRLLSMLFVFTLLFQMKVSAQYEQPVHNPVYALFLNTMYDNNSRTVTVQDYAANREDYALILDTRPEAEFNVSHIEGAIRVGFEDFALEFVQDYPEDTKIMIYCSVGGRSGIIGGQLREQGYSEVYNLYGGMFEWVNQEQEIVKPNGQVTLDVHPFDENWGRWLERGNKTYE